MKTRTFILALLVVPILFTSCQKINGKGDVVTVNRTVTDYSSIDLSMDGDVYYTVGTDYSLSIQAQENISDNIETYVSGSRLIIKVKNGVVLGSHDPIKFLITAPSVNALNISGSGNINVTNTMDENSVSVNISGSGNVTINDLVAQSFSGIISGSGNIDVITGAVTNETLTISGSGDIDMRYVVAKNVDATISGSGSIYVYAVDQLDATISGSGNVNYYGTPVINTHISGSGNLVHL